MLFDNLGVRDNRVECIEIMGPTIFDIHTALKRYINGKGLLKNSSCGGIFFLQNILWRFVHRRQTLDCRFLRDMALIYSAIRKEFVI